MHARFAGSGTLDDLKGITFLLCFPRGESPRLKPGCRPLSFETRRIFPRI